jgi:TonB family protein
MKLKCIIAAVLLFTTSLSFAQTANGSLSFEGRVVNMQGIPLSKATIKGYHSGINIETGVDGVFRLQLPARGDSVIITKEGLAVFSSMIQYSYKGVVVLSETGSAWLSYNEYIKQMEPTAKVYYDAGFKYLQGDADNAPDSKKAFFCFYRAANMEHAPAAYQLGKMYDEGIGTEQNYKSAIEWYEKAGRTPEAQTRLGVMYEEGIGVEQNYVTAARHFDMAKDYGDTTDAPQHLEALLAKGLVKQEDLIDNRIYEITETVAQFPGGDQASFKWLAQNIKYPAKAQEQGIQGRVFVMFVVNKDGSISDIEIKRSPDPILSQEAIRVVSRMPLWEPAMQGGKPVRCRFVLPIMFNLG